MSGISDRDKHHNPYQAPEGAVPAPIEELTGFLNQEAKSEKDERIAHLPQESTVRTIGLIHVLIGLVSLVNIGLLFVSTKLAHDVATLATALNMDPMILRGAMVATGFFGFAVYVPIGSGLRGLKNWARWTIVVLLVLGLLGNVPLLFNPQPLVKMPGLELASTIIGTALSIAMLVVLFLPAYAFTCSKHYHFLISETREIVPKLSLVAKLLLGTYLLAVGLGLASLF